jgi:4-hydroxybenzoate polyprenyltransferase
MSNRWWIYQQERFPIFKNGLLIAVFSLAAIGYSRLLRNAAPALAAALRSSSPTEIIAPALIAAVTLFLCFLQLRIADEFKDFAEDVRYRAYRPVPRGLVTLRELGIVAIGSAAVQLGLALALGLPLVLLLAIVWGYMGLMSKEFFVPTWLKAHPLIYLLSHMLIMPLLALYAAACDWLAAEAAPAKALGWFLAVSFFNGMAIELGRKIRAPQDEEPGVETYSALWGRQTAVGAWLGAIWLSAVLTLLAARAIDFTLPVYLLVLVLLTAAVATAWRYSVHPVPTTANRLEWMSGVWTLGVYFSLGVLPLLLS